MKPLFNYLAASRVELTKVTWPTRRQTVRLTIVVVIFSLIMAAALALIDMAFSNLVQKIIVKG